ncbi:hypothetical protein [Paraburkholderia sp. BL10I2N1]|nr:hypothetical protein [Paraburkholderia sp. BL10I2N1]TDN62143.1 hypothetical protein B0G77_5676 [Paraburkholderia sp. BL10I2N1]
MDTYILLGCGFGLGLLIAIWGIWNLRQPPERGVDERVAEDADGYQLEHS